MSTEEEQSSAKRIKSSNNFLTPYQTIEYPHGGFGACCITSSSDTLFSAARRHVKAFKKEGPQWSATGEIAPPGWKHGDMRSCGGPTALAVFENKYLIVGDFAGDLHLYHLNKKKFTALDYLEYRGDESTPEKDRAITSVVVLDNQTFLAASLDGSLYVWTLDLGSEEDFVPRNGPDNPHSGSAIRSCLKLSDNSVATGGEDNNICIWSTETVGPTTYRDWSLIKRLRPNEGFVVQMALVGNTLVSVHELYDEKHYRQENRIFVWDMDWKQKTMFMAKTTYKINTVIPYSADTVLFSSLNGAEFWNTTTWEYQGNSREAKGSCTVCGDTYIFGCGFLHFYERASST